jgi:hypothetical protein
VQFYAARCTLANDETIAQLRHQRQPEAKAGGRAFRSQSASIIADVNQQLPVRRDHPDSNKPRLPVGITMQDSVGDRLGNAQANIVELLTGDACGDGEPMYVRARQRHR